MEWLSNGSRPLLMIRPIRILLAEDHALIRAGIRALLEKSPAMKVVAEAADSHQVLRLAKIRKPDVVVMDAALGGHSGLRTTAQLHRGQHPQIPVVLLSASDGHVATEAFKASASAYMLTTCKPAQLNLAIRNAFKGRRCITSGLIRGCRPDAFVECEGRPPPRSVLTARQREILRLIGEGTHTKAIASFLGVSPKTVEFHRMQLMNRLNTRTIAGLVRHAIRLGLVRIKVVKHN
jgi:DNA-binding NarL/FixJ family response regulator